MFASLFGKSKELEEANELDLPVSYVRLVASQAQADRHPRSAHLTSTSSIRPLLARVKCNMTLSTSTAFLEPVPTLTAVQHRSSTWTWQRRPEDMDGRQRKDVATRLSARRLEERCCSVSCQGMTFGYDVNIYSKAASQRSFTFAEDLLSALHDHRQGPSASRRPIVFIGHSLGGIVIKKVELMLLFTSNSQLRLTFVY